MKILRGFSTNPATSPFPPKDGIFFELRGGDFCEPYGPGDWFDVAKPFTKAWKFTTSRAWLPFVSWRWGTRGGYCGAKCYEVDSPTYVSFAGDSEVHPGSQALMLSCRPFATIDN